MFTDTDETRGLEEWNVNTIAHLEPEKPESLSALWDGGAWASCQPIAGANPQIFLFVLLYSNKNQQHQKKWISSLSIRHSFHLLAKEGSLHTTRKWGERWPFRGQAAVALPPLTSTDEKKHPQRQNKIHRRLLAKKNKLAKTKLKFKIELDKNKANQQ